MMIRNGHVSRVSLRFIAPAVPITSACKVWGHIRTLASSVVVLCFTDNAVKYSLFFDKNVVNSAIVKCKQGTALTTWKRT